MFEIVKNTLAVSVSAMMLTTGSLICRLVTGGQRYLVIYFEPKNRFKSRFSYETAARARQS